MKFFKAILILLFCVSWTSICHAQKNTVALVDSKSFYNSGNGIIQLVNALKLVNPNFLSLTAEEKDIEFKKIAGKCRDAKNELKKVALDTGEKNVCVAIKDISEYAEKFKQKRDFFIITDISSCSYVTHLCETAIDITQQFISEYNRMKNTLPD
jgi:Skp family chaperone for outer membrane proteins